MSRCSTCFYFPLQAEPLTMVIPVGGMLPVVKTNRFIPSSLLTDLEILYDSLSTIALVLLLNSLSLLFFFFSEIII